MVRVDYDYYDYYEENRFRVDDNDLEDDDEDFPREVPCDYVAELMSRLFYR